MVDKMFQQLSNSVPKTKALTPVVYVQLNWYNVFINSIFLYK